MFLKTNSRWHRRWALFPLAMALVALIIYAPSLRGPFLTWDDRIYVLDSPLVTTFSIDNLHQIFAAFHFTDYAPLNTLALALEYALWGPNPAAFHAVTLALHVLNATLVFFILGRLLCHRRAAAIAALIFLVHPVQVESVAWIAEHKQMLSAALVLGACALHISARSRWAVILVGMAAMLAKPIAIVLPVLLIAFDRIVLQRSWRSAILDQVPLLLFAAFATAMNVLAQRALGTITAYHGGWWHLWGMLSLPGRYVLKLMLPWPLCILYAFEYRGFASVGFILLTAAILMASVLAMMRGRRLAAFGIAWWFVAWVPVSNAVPMVIWMADRYMYLPMAGALLAVASLVLEGGGRRCRSALPIALCVMLAVFAVLSRQRASLWGSNLAFWQSAAACSASAVAETNLAGAWFDLGRLDEAKAAMGRAFAVGSEMPRGYGMYGEILLREGRREAAAAAFLTGGLLDPNSAPFMDSLVRALGVQPKERWLRLFDRLGQEPNGVQLQMVLAQSLAKVGPDFAAPVSEILQRSVDDR